MISLTPNTALMLYLGLTLVCLLGVWIVSHYRSRNRSVMPLEQRLITCEFCLFAYLDSDSKNITKCPRCDSYNSEIVKISSEKKTQSYKAAKPKKTR